MAVEHSKVVAYQGLPGAYSHQAASQFFANETTVLRPYPQFLDILQAVESGQAEYAVLPIENALAGFVLPACDLLLQTSLHIQAEILLDIHHCLLAKARTCLAEISTVISHPQALAQCSDYLTKHAIQTEDYSNTAAAAQAIAQQSDHTLAAIASEYAAKQYALTILARNIANQPNNQTRFFILSQKGLSPDSLPERCKTLYLLASNSIDQTLKKIMTSLDNTDVNIVNIQPRPQHTHAWQYVFLIELEGSPKNSLNRLKTHLPTGDTLRFLGQYPCATQ